VVGLAAPAVGPAPASRDASSFVIFSISVVHGPAPAVPMGKTARVQAPSSKVIVFMAFLPVVIAKAAYADFRPPTSTGTSSERSALCSSEERSKGLPAERQVIR
jgi:hypothetical protein